MPSMRRHFMALVLSVVSAGAAASGPGTANPPGPIQSVVSSPAIGHAFNDPAFQNIPEDIRSEGYIQNEYIISGNAHIYTYTPGKPNNDVGIMGTTAYVDRMLVRRPADPTRFSGDVVVEVINSALNFDALAGWPYMRRHITRAGDIWIGLTASPAGIRSLKFANPRRYASLGFGPSPDQRCHSTGPEVGAIFDILTQTSRLLRQPDNPLNPLRGLDVKALIGLGYSQGALILASYTNAIAPNADGPTFDGYISIAGIGGYALNNCESLTDFASRVLTPVSNGTPLMQVQTTSETILLPLGLPGESAHDRDTQAPYRYYDLAGSGHLDGILIDHAPDAADLLAAGGYNIEGAVQGCRLAYPISHFPSDIVYGNLLARMELWIHQGLPPPASRHFLLGGWVLPGHAVGGLPSPASEVPVADYFVGAGLPLVTFGGGFSSGIPCFFASIQNNYSRSQLRRMYGSHDQYVEQVRRSSQQLLQDGFLQPADAADIVHQAEVSTIP